MARSAAENLGRDLGEAFRDLTVPLFKQQFARHQNNGNLPAAQGVAHRADRCERLAAAGRVLEDASAALRLPALKGSALMRPEHPAARRLPRLEPFRRLDLA